MGEKQDFYETIVTKHLAYKVRIKVVISIEWDNAINVKNLVLWKLTGF